MRGIQKGRPPRNVSPDGQNRRSWEQAEAEFSGSLQSAIDRAPHARTTFNALDKHKLREVLYQEQGGLCVYCESRVKEGHPPPRIDHWLPLTARPDLALHWPNLYLSCAATHHCDSRKGDTPLRADSADPDLPWPVQKAYEVCIGFTSLGEIYVRTDAPLDDAQRRALILTLGTVHDDTTKDNGILNLNHPALIAARRAALDGEKRRLERDFAGRATTPEARAERANHLKEQPRLPEFVSIRIRWLDKTLGKAK